MLFNKNFYIRSFLLAVLFLTACVNSPVNSTNLTASTAVAETSIATSNNYIAKHNAAVDLLLANDINIFQIGDNIRFIIPSDKLFEQRTSVISNEGYGILNNIVKLIKHQKKFSIKIAAHTDNKVRSEIALALTTQQAQVIGKYLWKQNIDSRFLSTLGYGSSEPIANNILEKAQVLNRRLEIDLILITDNTLD